MSIIDKVKSYFNKKLNNKEVASAPEGVCPNCWGKQEWDGEFYKKIKAHNITPENNTYTSFVHKVVEKLDKIVLKGDTYTCESYEVSYAKS